MPGFNDATRTVDGNMSGSARSLGAGWVRFGITRGSGAHWSSASRTPPSWRRTSVSRSASPAHLCAAGRGPRRQRAEAVPVRGDTRARPRGLRTAGKTAQVPFLVRPRRHRCRLSVLPRRDSGRPRPPAAAGRPARGRVTRRRPCTSQSYAHTCRPRWPAHRAAQRMHGGRVPRHLPDVGGDSTGGGAGAHDLALAPRERVLAAQLRPRRALVRRPRERQLVRPGPGRGTGADEPANHLPRSRQIRSRPGDPDGGHVRHGPANDRAVYPSRLDERRTGPLVLCEGSRRRAAGQP